MRAPRPFYFVRTTRSSNNKQQVRMSAEGCRGILYEAYPIEDFRGESPTSFTSFRDEVLKLEKELAAIQERVCLTHELFLNYGQKCHICRLHEVTKVLKVLKSEKLIEHFDTDSMIHNGKVYTTGPREHTGKIQELINGIGMVFDGLYINEDNLCVCKWVDQTTQTE